AFAAVAHFGLYVGAVVETPDAAGDGERLAVEAIHFAADCETHLRADAGGVALLRFVGRVETDDAPRGALPQQFGEKYGAVARGAAADVIARVHEHDWARVRRQCLGDGGRGFR